MPHLETFQIEWARAHDSEVRAMGAAGRQFVQENLMPKDIFCYHALLLQVSRDVCHLYVRKYVILKI